MGAIDPFEEKVKGAWVKIYSTLNGLYLNGRKVSDNRQGWHEAWTYTESVREECRQMDREIKIQQQSLDVCIEDWSDQTIADVERTVTRLRALREAAGRGLREEAR